MTNRDEAMNDMWTALESYQPFADLHGFGDAWLKMTTERTAAAARTATLAAEAAWFEIRDAARAAADAAEEAADAAATAAWAAADMSVVAAIKYINNAIEIEENK